MPGVRLPVQVHALAPGNLVQLPCQLGVHAIGQHQGSAAVHAAGDLQRRRQVLVGLDDDGQVGANLRQIGQGATGVDVKKL